MVDDVTTLQRKNRAEKRLPLRGVDRLTQERRSWNMSRIRGKNTSPEMRVRSLLHDPPGQLASRFSFHFPATWATNRNWRTQPEMEPLEPHVRPPERMRSQ